MDILSLVGVFLALVALIGGSILKGAGVSSLLNPAAFLIVVVGTIASILLQTQLKVFMRAMKILPWVFKPPVIDFNGTIEKITEWSNIARKQGLLGLEPAIQGETDEFTQARPAVPGRRRRTGVPARDPRDGDGGTRRARDGAPRRSSRAWASTRPRSASSARCSA